MYQLKIIGATEQPSYQVLLVAEWVAAQAQVPGTFEVEVLDLHHLNLPVLAKPYHPALRQYTQAQTRRWSCRIAGADAFIFVTAEQKGQYPAPLQNALDYLTHEWANKPAGIVSYADASAEAPTGNALRHDLAAYRMVPLAEAVSIPCLSRFLHDEHFTPSELITAALRAQLIELARWAEALSSLRQVTMVASDKPTV